MAVVFYTGRADAVRLINDFRLPILECLGKPMVDCERPFCTVLRCAPAAVLMEEALCIGLPALLPFLPTFPARLMEGLCMCENTDDCLIGCCGGMCWVVDG